ncbi:MAG: hypothetical protein ACJ768_13555, partial [Gaiellaceae bacterium]
MRLAVSVVTWRHAPIRSPSSGRSRSNRSRMNGHGAHVTIIEVDPVRALEALMDGFQVMTAGQAAAWGDLFVTATGNVNVFRREHFAA